MNREELDKLATLSKRGASAWAVVKNFPKRDKTLDTVTNSEEKETQSQPQSIEKTNALVIWLEERYK